MNRSSSRMRVRIAVGLAAAAMAAVPLTMTAKPGHASLPLNCHGYGGQGAGGFISSFVQSCEQGLETLLASPPPVAH